VDAGAALNRGIPENQARRRKSSRPALAESPDALAVQMKSRLIFVLNVGSTSLKYGLHRVAGAGCETVESGEAEGSDLAAIETTLSAWPAPDMVGHRIVHGGPRVRDHCLIDDAVMTDLEAAKALAPLHAPPALDGVRWARRRFADLPQVACLDTAFHAGMPDVAKTYPLPRHIREAGVFRYGFHGLSCASIVRQLGADTPDRLVIAHLGGGCSVTAVASGRSIDTTMGLTPSGGMMMATRVGDLDPGVLIYIAREWGMAPEALEDMVDRRGGLLGASGRSGDLRKLLDHPQAESELAIAMFVRSAAKAIAAMMTSLGGADLLVFTGGVGEHDGSIRSAITDSLSWASVGAVRVLPSLEDAEIARISAALAI
jgi:acetate kinase